MIIKPGAFTLAANGANSTLTGITVDGYRWHDYYQCSVQTWKGCLNDYPHIDGVMMLVGSTPQVPNTHLGTPQSPIIIRNSMFYNNYQYLTNTGGNACIFITSFGGRVLMYNNVFSMCSTPAMAGFCSRTPWR